MLFSQLGGNRLKAYALGVASVGRALISSVFHCNNKYRFFFTQSLVNLSEFNNLN